jgi:hypothetical protein
MLDRIGISRYAKSDREQVLEFLPTVFPPARARRLSAQWDWKYAANPFNRDADPYILLLRDGDKIIGMLGALPLRVSIRGDPYLANSGCDAMIHPSYRGHDLFARMIEFLLQHHPIGIGWGNSASNHIWKDPTTGNTRIIPLIALSILHGYGLGRHEVDSSSNQIQVRPIERFDSRFDDLWQSVRLDYPVMLIRDQRYLNWRFVERPDEKYMRLCATRGNELLGYLVVRIASRDGTRIGYLVDWTVKSQSLPIFFMLARHAFAHIRAEGARWISVRTTTPYFRRAFYRMGFVPWYGGPPVYAITQVAVPDEKLFILNDMRQWFSTMGDSDLEMSL